MKMTVTMLFSGWQRVFALVCSIVIINEFSSFGECTTTFPEVNETLSNKTNTGTVNKEVDLYRNLFKIKRKEHLAVVQKLILIDDVAKLASFLEVSLNTIVETLSKSMLDLERNNYQPGDAFPKEMNVKEELSKVLENTAFFTDLIVRFPRPSRIFYKRNKNIWKKVLNQAIEICYESGIFDGDYELLLHNLKQELGIGLKDENYTNPFLSQVIPESQLTSEERQELYEAAKRKKKLLKQKKKRKLPKITLKQEL